MHITKTKYIYMYCHYQKWQIILMLLGMIITRYATTLTDGSNIWNTDTWQIFGLTIEYIAIHSVFTENVSIT